MSMAQEGGFETGFTQVDAKDLFFVGDTGNNSVLDGYDENGDKIDPDSGKGEDPKNPKKEETKVDDGQANDNNVEGTVSQVISGKSFLEKLSSRGLIGDLSEMELMLDDKPVDLSEINNEDDLLDVLEGLIKAREEDMLKDKMDTSDLSGFMRKLIEVDKVGGDMSSLLNAYQKLQAPIDNIDLSDKRGQMMVIHHYYKMLGLSDDDIKDNMEMMESKGDDFIESKANKFHSVIKEKMEAMVEEERKEAEKKKADAMERMKSYKKSVRASIGKNFQVNDNMLAKAVDFVTKPVNNEGNTAIDIAYTNMIKDPEAASDLIMFLMNKDEFIKQKTNKATMETKRSVINVLRGNKKDNKTDVGGGDDESKYILDVGLAKS